MEMLLRAYDSMGRDVFSSSSESDTADYSDNFSSFGGGSDDSKERGANPGAPATHRPRALQPHGRSSQPGMGSRMLHDTAGRPVMRQGRGLRNHSQVGTATRAALQSASDADDCPLSWGARGGEGDRTEVALRDATQAKAAVWPSCTAPQVSHVITALPELAHTVDAVTLSSSSAYSIK